MAFADFQMAVSAALKSWPALAAIVGVKVFDDVPHKSEPIDTSFPYVTIGEQSGDEAGSDTHNAAEMKVAIRAWSRAPGRLQCLQMLDVIRDALHDKSLFVATGLVVFLLYEAHETQKDPDGETYQGIIRFKGLYQYGG